MSTYQYKSGLGSAASYQVSGKPFASGSINIDTESSSGTDPFVINFPTVTRWVNIRNHDARSDHNVFVAFSKNGLPSQGGSNYFKIPDAGATTPNSPAFRLELKITEIWLEGTSTEADIIAGLTGIETKEIVNNWSGSAGVG